MPATRPALAGVLVITGFWLLLLGHGVSVAYDSDAAALGFAGLCTSAFFGLLAWAWVMRTGLPWRERLGFTRGRLAAPAALLAILGFVAFSMGLYGAIAATGLKAHSVLPEIERSLAGARGAPLALLLFGLAAAPALGEELLFRGALLRGLLPRVGPLAAIGISAGVFGLAHVDPVHVLTATGLGLYLGLLTWRAAALWPAVLAHAANNTVAVLVPALAPGSTEAPTWAAAPIGLLGITALAWLACGTRIQRVPPEESRSSPDRPTGG